MPDILLLDSWNVWPKYVLWYLEEGILKFKVRNAVDKSVNLVRATASFETEDGFDEYVENVDYRAILRPDHVSDPITIGFKVGLSLKEGSRYITLRVYFRVDGRNEEKVEQFQGNLIVINTIGDRGKHFFISHKDPEDTSLAIELKKYLRKTGFDAFIAEDERRPGSQFWNQKIIPAIKSCLGTIVIWTFSAKTGSRAIELEAKVTMTSNKPFVLLREDTIGVPKAFRPNTFEYSSAESRISKLDIARFAEEVTKTYEEGKYGIQ